MARVTPRRRITFDLGRYNQGANPLRIVAGEIEASRAGSPNVFQVRVQGARLEADGSLPLIIR